MRCWFQPELLGSWTTADSTGVEVVGWVVGDTPVSNGGDLGQLLDVELGVLERIIHIRQQQWEWLRKLQWGGSFELDFWIKSHSKKMFSSGWVCVVFNFFFKSCFRNVKCRGISLLLCFAGTGREAAQERTPKPPPSINVSDTIMYKRVW